MSDWIDTHCHLDAPEFNGDRRTVRERARRAGVVHCVIPAVDAASFDAVRTLAEEGDDFYALGIHPLRTPQARRSDLDGLERLLVANRNDGRLVAVGEIGLDYFVPGIDTDTQSFFYREQLAMAARHQLPVILHVRRSADALLRELRRCRVVGGIAHAFNGSLQQAHVFLDLGFKLGFGGTLSFERSAQIRRLARELPLDAIVLETDSPDIPPQWLYRTAAQREQGQAQGRNEPAEVPRIGAVLADLRGLDPQRVAEVTTANARRVLALPASR